MLFEVHPSFNKEYYADAIDYINHHASRYGLEIEVQETFCMFLETAFNSDDYPLNLKDYMGEANDALYEWGI